MIFGHTLAESRKALVSFIALVGAILALTLSGYDPNFTQACIALVGPAFGVVGVFMAKNHSVDDLQKSVEQLKAAALTIVGYFTVVPASTAQLVAIISGGIVSAFAVWWIPNKK